MAIYHMQAKVVSRGSGRSAVAASAYMSCSRIYNITMASSMTTPEKHGLIYQEVMLPLWLRLNGKPGANSGML